MSNLSMNVQDVKQNAGLNIQELKQSEIWNNANNDLILLNNNSLTQVYGGDVSAIFRTAYFKLSMSELQYSIVNAFQECFLSIESKIDPQRLTFTITESVDNEICINRKASTGGLVKLCIENDDIMLSFIPDKQNSKSKSIDFFTYGEDADLESITYRFFSF